MLIESPQRRAAIGASALDDVVATTRSAPARARSTGRSRRCSAAAIDRSSSTGSSGRRSPASGGYPHDLPARERPRGARAPRPRVRRGARPRQAPSDREVAALVEREFGPLEAELVVGNDAIAAADVSIATNWPTAFTVAAHRGSLFKAYLVQEYEPALYDEGRPGARRGRVRLRPAAAAHRVRRRARRTAA